MNYATLSILVGLMTAVGCGAAAPQARTLVQSPIVRTKPPLGLHYGDINGWRWSSRGGQTVIKLVPPGSVGGANRTLHVPGALVVGARSMHEAGTDYLVVGVLDAAENFSMRRYHDQTGDGAPDSSSELVLFQTTTPLYGTSFSRRDDAAMFVLDRRCQDVFVALDADKDGWADTLQSTPFAMSRTFRELLDARDIRATSDGGIRTGRALGVPNVDDPYERYSDTDGDDVADAHSSGPGDR